jgi:DNA adenine methylase
MAIRVCESPQPLKAPFPWYGGKSRAAPLIWEALGNVPNLVIPFAGSLAELWGRPHAPQLETVNDLDCFIVNVWRALQADPAGVAQWCDFPVNEAQQHAVHTWLVEQRETFTARLMGDPEYYDAQIAGRWLYGICCWIGSGWCSGAGPWQSVEGQFVHVAERQEQGVKRQRVHLGNQGRGVHRQHVHLENQGRGVYRKRFHLGQNGGGQGIHATQADGEDLYAWFEALQARLRSVRVCCGDWRRVLGPTVTFKHGLTGIVLDPPYSAEEGRDPHLYAVDDLAVAHAVRAWSLEHGNHPLLRIVLCGYGEVHDELLAQGWRKVHWTANGGFSNQRKKGTNLNKYQETLWFSPRCLRTEPEHQLRLFP